MGKSSGECRVVSELDRDGVRPSQDCANVVRNRRNGRDALCRARIRGCFVIVSAQTSCDCGFVERGAVEWTARESRPPETGRAHPPHATVRVPPTEHRI